ncbi:hypothetical protein [Orlajensenia leifsoniae]|uniref:RES domain-containing protein n=1 Tax=Orlajensenia leifsoniae TaxID=2561933 RepID=A0A4Y9R366_9MICO|nr:hypothetical protein [Leifsonia flava]TFV98770.1 hypothetical protein E4M00_04455 [Leifsonia flava]
MRAAGGRICTETGLRLMPCTGDSGFRVSKSRYPPISAPVRTADEHRDGWGRYDTFGSTLYVAETIECAFSEVLAGFRRKVGTADPLAADAEAVGMTVEEFVRDVSREWSERGFMSKGALPALWRDVRGINEIITPSNGWWIDIEDPDSMAALEAHPGIASEIRLAGVDALTTADLRGPYRPLTTGIADELRLLTLDDGSKPVGIHFGSKWGGGWCRAIWLPEEDAAYELELLALSPEPILVNDGRLATVAQRFGLRVF